MLGFSSIPALTILIVGARGAGEGLNSRVAESYGGVKFDVLKAASKDAWI